MPRFDLPEIDPIELKARLDRGDAPMLLDVRQPWEFGIGRIAGSVLIPLPELADRLSELDREREIVTVCKVGERSAYAADLLRRAGFARVVNLRGGIFAWAADIDPTVLP